APLHEVPNGNMPYPSFVVERFLNLVGANGSAALYMEGSEPELLKPPVNVLRLSMHPDGMARNILNLAEWRAHMIDRVRRHVALTADASLARLHRELRAFPGDVGEAIAPPEGAEVLVPLRMRAAGREQSVFRPIATFGPP